MSKLEKLAKVATSPTKEQKKIKDEIKKETEKMIQEIVELQQQMFAQGKYSMLVVFQGVDAAGKDGAVRNVFGPVNPAGCRIEGFGVPSKSEKAHDFLWRVHQKTPSKGMITVFNRSHYEDIIIPTLIGDMDDTARQTRYDNINNFEKLLADNNTIILKFLLHVGKEKQEEKLRERLVNHTKYRKHNDDDWNKKEDYDRMLTIYDHMMDHTNTDYAPWHIIPTDNNRLKAYLIAKQVLQAFKKRMKLERPELDTEMKILNVGEEK